MENERIKAYMTPEIFSHVVEQAAIAIRKASDSEGLHFYIRPDLPTLAHAIREALQKSVDASPWKARYDIEIKDLRR